ncbi:4Fe-4S dicluster domain-containing protein [Chloroflexota bacterium]
MRFGMVIDLSKCAGCYSCTVACQQEHFLPSGIFWNRLMISETGEYPLVANQVYPVLCNHCKDAICVKVCPTRATQQREDGLVWIDSDKCVGCRYCLIACPYQTRSYNAKEKEYLGIKQGQTEFGKLGTEVYPHQTGVVIKCNYCMERIDIGLANSLKPGVDRDATPNCVNTCPTGSRHFGDLDDPNSEVSRLIREHKGQQFHPEYGTDPSTYYIRS